MTYIIVFGAIIALITFWLVAVSIKTKKFFKQLKTGQFCHVFVGKERYLGIIDEINPNLPEAFVYIPQIDKEYWYSFEDIYP